MKRELQLKLWLHGNSVHNIEFDECCPDFSCCIPALLAPKEERMRFFHATEEERMEMLAGFLERMMVSACGPEKAKEYEVKIEGTDVYIVSKKDQQKRVDKKIPSKGA